MLLLGRRRARMRPRAFGAYERFAEGKTSAQAEFISAEHPNHFGGIRGALAPHGTGPTIMGPMISKMFIVAQGSFPTSMLLLGRRRAGRILSKMFILCGFPCSVKGKRRVRDAAPYGSPVRPAR